ncbi:MAG: tRNA 2-thiouridine(34) synthase MnmA [Actinomycetota bacterium]|nr:tRNA 2-thiouridine(34) synthase MnmA [Actinomycetota bacterium]
MQKLKKEKILLAMSGGVDSSVAAYLLLKEGFDIAGVTMNLGISNSSGHTDDARSDVDDSIKDARAVCEKLGIQHYIFDYSKELEENVIKDFVNTYISGQTPNPCIECNKLIKFGLLIEKAVLMGFDYFATGHYASIIVRSGDYFIGKAADSIKDQSYFLYRIRKEKLPFIKFPLSEYKKDEVKKISEEIGMDLHEKKESQEICFIKNKNYHEFIKDRLGRDFGRQGNILDINGKIIGRHKGVAFYTIGQRKGFGISHEKPLYVTSIDIENNEIVVGERSYLAKKGLIAGNLNWFTDEIPDRALAKIRYNHKEVECSIAIMHGFKTGNDINTKEINGNGNDIEPGNFVDDRNDAEDFINSGKKIYVNFSVPQESVTPGQSVVFYDMHDSRILLGGGTIIRGTDL